MRWSGPVVCTIDMLLALVIVFMAMASPPAKPPKPDQAALGSLTFVLGWPASKPDCQNDVDLWIEAPGDKPVGYSNKAGPHVALLRDDLGCGISPDSHSQEFAIGTDAWDGEYVVNVMLYRHFGGKLPLHVTVLITADANTVNPVVVDQEEVTLAFDGEEVTAARFTIDKGGHFVLGSISHLPHHIYGTLPS